MKNFISCIIFQSFLIILPSYAQYTDQSKFNYFMVPFDQAFSRKSSTGQKIYYSLVLMYKCGSNETQPMNKDDLYQKFNCIKGDNGWRINDDLVNVIEQYCCKNKKIISDEIPFYYAVLKASKARSHYQLYFLPKEYPYWRNQKTRIKELENYIKIIIYPNYDSEVRRIRYDK